MTEEQVKQSPYPPPSPHISVQIWDAGGWMARLYTGDGELLWRQWYSSRVSAFDAASRKLGEYEHDYRNAHAEWKSARAKLAEKEFQESQKNG